MREGDEVTVTIVDGQVHAEIKTLAFDESCLLRTGTLSGPEGAALLIDRR